MSVPLAQRSGFRNFSNESEDDDQKVKGDDDDVLAVVETGDLSDEAAIRLLKAKVRVMQEEVRAFKSDSKGRSELVGELQAKYVQTTQIFLGRQS